VTEIQATLIRYRDTDNIDSINVIKIRDVIDKIAKLKCEARD